MTGDIRINTSKIEKEMGWSPSCQNVKKFKSTVRVVLLQSKSRWKRLGEVVRKVILWVVEQVK